MWVLEAENVWFKYPGSEDYVLKGVSVKVREGETYFIAGDNGVGKSTLLLVLSGLLKPNSGEVRFMGKPLHALLPRVRREIGLLFQNPELMLFNPTVYDEVAYALRQLHNDPREVEEKVKNAVLRVGLPLRVLDKYTYKLSYGEKKLVALASIIAYEPKLLMLDEPYTNLSLKYVERVNKIVLEHKAKRGSTIMVGHLNTGVLEVVDHTLLLEDGTLKAKL